MANTDDYSNQVQQKAADQYGISLQEYKDLLAKYPPVYQPSTYGNQYGMTSGQPIQSPQMTSALQTLSLIKKYGKGAAVAPTPAPEAGSQTAFGTPQGGTTAAGQQGGTYYGSAPMGTQNAFGISQVGSGDGYALLKNAQGQQIAIDNSGNYFQIDAAGNHIPVSDIDAQNMGFQSANPETNALKQMAQIDPSGEALRTSLGKSYAQSLSEAEAPTAGQYKSYLDLFKQVDPEEYAQRKGLATSMDSYLRQAQAENALGAQLDPVTQMQVEQQARKAQADRGNLYGAGQAATEAMSTGQAGEARKQQRMAALSGALGQQQSYLGAGLGMGDTAMQLYQQGLSNKASARQAGLGYLGSGQTPYQAGASYLDRADAAAAQAAQGGPVYNPASLGTSYSGSAQSAPQYGLDLGAQSQNYFNSLNNAYGGGAGAAQKNRTGAALSGAASGAIAGAPLAGSTYGLSVVGGAIAGGLGGYYSAPDRG